MFLPVVTQFFLFILFHFGPDREGSNGVADTGTDERGDEWVCLIHYLRSDRLPATNRQVASITSVSSVDATARRKTIGAHCVVVRSSSTTSTEPGRSRERRRPTIGTWARRSWTTESDGRRRRERSNRRRRKPTVGDDRRQKTTAINDGRTTIVDDQKTTDDGERARGDDHRELRTTDGEPGGRPSRPDLSKP